ncbi:MAG: fimbrillin family protein, partial [Rikenellaceae bacterium]|nr:fimbrillin family protein [Rikenellaceae bacterium]
KIQLNFSHLNTRLLVKVNINGTPASTSALSSVSVSGLKNSGVCNIGASEPSVEADGASVKMYPFAGTDSYELITVPQTIPAESLCVNLTYKGDLYEWASTSEITLPAGKTSSLTVNLAITKSASKGEIIVNGQTE